MNKFDLKLEEIICDNIGEDGFVNEVSLQQDISANYLPISLIKKVVEEMKYKPGNYIAPMIDVSPIYNQALSDLLTKLGIKSDLLTAIKES
jgi:hypothetical protein